MTGQLLDIERAETADDADAVPPLAIYAPTPLVASTSVLIADRNPVVRAGLVDFVRRNAGCRLAEPVADGESFIGECRTKRVDIGVIGWSLPDMTAADVLVALRNLGSRTRVIVYTADASPAVLRSAIKAGAWGFIEQSEDPMVLLDTLSAVARGRLSLPYVDLQQLAQDPLDLLTVRERELLGVLAKGLTNEQIATRIGISHNTVKYHLKNLYEKLDVKNRAMAVALFMSSTA